MLAEKIYHILTEDRSRRTVEFNPGWRISKGGKVVIDCYETQVLTLASPDGEPALTPLLPRLSASEQRSTARCTGARRL